MMSCNVGGDAHPGRGTGRTLRMVLALQPDTLVVVNSAASMQHVLDMLDRERPDLVRGVRIIAARNECDLDRLRGVYRFEVDHAVLEHGDEAFQYKLRLLMREKEKKSHA